MRLLNTWTLQLEEFYGGPPEYAILSHRWETDEVTYKDFELGLERSHQGYSKIYACCKLARSRDLQYVWVDTCCIDKRSSAELTESINSMYQWYQAAEECYAFLSDVHIRDLSSKQNRHNFRQSAWFTRGWTLQELIAPSRVYFYNSKWMFLASKDDQYALLSKITKINSDVLRGTVKPSECAISQRMSWAADRNTSRVEDRAYSLLGIFGVSMAMLYGEGDKAFRRLQEEIIKQSDDHTIFAWRDQSFAKSVLAPSPSCFRGLDDMGRIFPTNDTTHGYTFVNAGLSIQLPLIPWSMNTYIASLRCGYLKPTRQDHRRAAYREYERVCIFLQQTEHENQFIRVSVDGKDLEIIDGDAFAQMRDEFSIQDRHILVRQPNDSSPIKAHAPCFYGFVLSFGHQGMFARRQGSNGCKPRSTDVLCYHEWKPEVPLFAIQNGERHAAGILRLSGYHNGLFLYLGFDLDFAPLCLITSRTPRSDPQSRRFTLLPKFDALNVEQALGLLDLAWLRNEIKHGTQNGETVLAWKGDRRTRTVLQCRSLSLTLKFEWKRSSIVKMEAWHVNLGPMGADNRAAYKLTEFDDVISTPALHSSTPMPPFNVHPYASGDAPDRFSEAGTAVHRRPKVSRSSYSSPSIAGTMQFSDVTIHRERPGSFKPADTYW